MYPTISDVITQEAENHLIKNDSILKLVIQRAGSCTIRPHKDYYRELVDAIIGQQLSVKAAASIRKQFLVLFGGHFPEPGQILDKSVDELRSAGLSGAKVRYIQDLATHVIEGSVQLDHLDKLSNDEIIRELTAVKGIGEWTAHMFMMFAMGRTDILPTGDLGIRVSAQRLYGLETLPKPDELKDIAARNNWHPYESIASWYLWQALDNQPL